MAELASVADIIMGQSPPSPTYNEAGVGLPFFQGKADFGFRHPKPRLFCNAPLKIAKPRDILVSVRAPVGPTNIVDRECCIGRGLAAIHPRSIDSDFLFFNLRHIEKFIASLGSGSTFHAINKTQLSSVQVNQHGFDLHEQRKIASVLSLVQRAIEQQERLIVLTQELKKSLMHKLFTEGLHGERQKQTEIGPVPESWETDRLGNIANLKSGGTPSRSRPEYWQGGTIPWVKTGEVDYCLICETEEKITQEGLDNSSAKVFPPGTLLMAMYGQGITRGKVAILGIEAATNQACVAFFPKAGIQAKFLYYFFEAKYELIRNLGHGANQKNLSADLLSTVLLAFPSSNPEDQGLIVSMLEAVDNKIAVTKKKVTLLSDLFRTLLHQLMTAQIRVHDLDLSFLEGEAKAS
jgi:type I restriction enzyme S subunit